MNAISSEAELEERLASPSASDVDAMHRLDGDVIVLGAGGKMGPSLVRRIRAATEAAGVDRHVIAVSRFSSAQARRLLEDSGVETIACDLLDPGELAKLPPAENVLFLAGRKFGSSDRSDVTWAINSYLPGIVAERFRTSRIVAFSTGNVYPFVTPNGRGSVESDTPMPHGEYAQSCLARERVFEYFSHTHDTRVLIYRLNYAVDLRYGVLVDIARRVRERQPISVVVPWFNVIWQGDANSYALRSLALCESPPRILNVTGPETLSVRDAAHFFAERFGCDVDFEGEESQSALLSDASLCHSLLGRPSVLANTLMEWVAHWIEIGGATLDKPTKFDVVDGRY